MTKKKNHLSSIVSFFLSLLTHAIIFLLLGVGLTHCYHAVTSQETTPPAPPPEVVLNLSPPLPEKKPTISTVTEHPLQKAPAHTAFESDQNSEAASEQTPTGDTPMPTQEGHHDDDLQLKNQQHTQGDHPAEGVLNQPSAMISSKDTFTQQENRMSSNVNNAEEHKISPTPQPSVASTPLPPAGPALAATTPELPKDKPVMGTLSSQAKAQGYQADERASVIHGNISNKGKGAVAAEATPLGRYKKNLSEAISSRWYYYIDDHMELLSFGTATISFYVTQQGKVDHLRIISNTSNQAFADCCIKSIMEAKLPIIPPEVAATLQEGHLEIEYRFTIYPNSN